jgi:RimJ/RimL family protein N-acetyltransferase
MAAEPCFVGMIQSPETLTTAQLKLRVPRIEDADAIFEEYAADPDVTRYMTWVPHETAETVATFLRDALGRHADGSEFSWVIEKSLEPGAIGMISARVRGHKADIGYCLTKKLWNQGYMTEAIVAIRDWLLSQPSIYRVWAVCDTENIGSARVLEKSGFVREGTLRRWMIHPNCPGGPRDCFMYGRTR